MTAPRVSIGLPVYNGERFLAEAIDSILAQTFADFELIISDNASTDGTGAICQAYAAKDSRIIYNRQERNLGAAPNFNYVFHVKHPDAEYFRWHAHDDTIAPGYLARCVAALDHDSGVVLVQSMVQRIDPTGMVIETLTPFVRWELEGSHDPIRRFAARSCNRRCLEVFGLIRKSALVGSELHGPYIGMDRTLLLELALRGRFMLISEPLFGNREHGSRATRVTRTRTRADLNRFYGANSTRSSLPSWAYLAAGARVIRRNVPSARDRARCAWHFARSLRQGWTWAFLVLDPLAVVLPDAVQGLRRGIRRLRTGMSRHSNPRIAELDAYRDRIIEVEVYEGPPCRKCGSTERLASCGKCRKCAQDAAARARATRKTSAAVKAEGAASTGFDADGGRAHASKVHPDSLLDKLPWEIEP